MAARGLTWMAHSGWLLIGNMASTRCSKGHGDKTNSTVSRSGIKPLKWLETQGCRFTGLKSLRHCNERLCERVIQTESLPPQLNRPRARMKVIRQVNRIS